MKAAFMSLPEKSRKTISSLVSHMYYKVKQINRAYKYKSSKDVDTEIEGAIKDTKKILGLIKNDVKGWNDNQMINTTI